MNRLVFLGPPGAGKGTQAARLASELHIPHLSTGDILRAAVAGGTALGREADQYMRAGQLVPDPLVVAIVADALRSGSSASGFILDGFPRTLVQAEKLAALVPIDRVVAFKLPESELIDRLTQRRQCPKCGTVYNLKTLPPRVAGVCDRDGTPLVHRSDDRPEAVTTRLKAYHEQTEPLIDYYRKHDDLRTVDASGDLESVAARVRTAVAS
ncbi:MAG TPA: adenylate kinase [Thermoplasmata archaeon]|nr:adenylate kinase [Thermoplasmata archaeon]